MIVVMQPGADQQQIEQIEARLHGWGYTVYRSDGEMHTILGAVGTPREAIDLRDLELLPGVHQVVRVGQPFKLVNRMFRPEGTLVDVAGVRIGSDELIVIAGPCAVESLDQMQRAAEAVARAGARILRGGAFKPRTSPYAFQGLGEEGLRILRRAADEHGLACVTEVVDTREVELVAQYADMLQVGARNMQNFRLLAAVGEQDKPVMLKRGLSATLEELLMAAEYIAAQGNPRVVLCERGVRTFEPWTRNTMDLSAIPVLRKVTHLPIVVDPSHGTGIRESVTPMARAGVAAGADGVMVEVHPDPDRARCDGAQSLNPEGFVSLMEELRIIAPAVRKHLPRARRSPVAQVTQPVFQRAVVVGVGLIGGSLALALRETAAVGSCLGVDRADNLDAVRAADVVERVFSLEEMEQALAKADLVVLAAPVGAILEMLPRIGPLLAPGTLVTDVGGTKSDICARAADLPSGVWFVGGHPMAGSERRGPGAADSWLFMDAVWALCPEEHVPQEIVARLRRLIEAVGAQPVQMTPVRHDRLAAAVSHVPHLVAAALASSVGELGTEDELALRLAAGGFRDLTRSASSGYEMWQDVLATNRPAVQQQLNAFEVVLQRIARHLTDSAALGDDLNAAVEHRARVPRCLPGLQARPAELLVRLPDEPGALAGMATALGRERINIRDFRLLHLREEEESAVSLGFADLDTTQRARSVLQRAGYRVRLRED